jgi:hypothetical protein
MGKKKRGIGINKVEWLLMLPGMRKHLRRSIDDGILDLEQAVLGAAWLSKKMMRAANKEHKPIFGSLTGALTSTAKLIAKEEEMAKFELGITVGEITAMLPEVLAAAWASYSDDKKISVDEGIDLVAVVLDNMADAADDIAVSDFFDAQAQALRALAPFFEEEEAPEEPEPVADPE